jgi:hypothetical protein
VNVGIVCLAATAGLGDPHRPILDVTKAPPPPAVVPPGDEKHRELAGAAIRKHLDDTISTPGLERAARFYSFFIDEIAKTDRALLQPK